MKLTTAVEHVLSLANAGVLEEKDIDTGNVVLKRVRNTQLRAITKVVTHIYNDNAEVSYALKWTLELLETLDTHRRHNGIVKLALNEQGLKRWANARAISTALTQSSLHQKR